jgi:hypothetical protein
MTTLKFEIEINSTPEKLWYYLWNQESYKKWTAIFCEGSYYKTEGFIEGNRIHFLTPNGDGMYSDFHEIIVNKKMVFLHKGDIKNFEELPINENNYAWSDAFESYEISPIQNGVKLLVKAETVDEYIGFMNKTFPLALQELKILAENNLIKF